jgi:hypothetical protein
MGVGGANFFYSFFCYNEAMKKLILSFIIVFISACSSKSDYSFFLYPEGEGISTIGKSDPDLEYLSETCKGTSRIFKMLIDPKQEALLKNMFLKRYDLELIELVYFQGVMDKYEIRFIQSGCLDSQLSIDFKFFNKVKSTNEVIESIRRSIKDLKFTTYSKAVQESTLKATTYLAKNYKRKCKTDKNFVAYKERTLCSFKVGDLYYQLLWGITSDKEIVNLTSSYSPF